MIVGVVSETHPGERRIALTPIGLGPLSKAGLSVLVQAGAGQGAGFADQDFEAKGAKIAASRNELLQQADIVCCIRVQGAAGFRSGQTVVGLVDPLSNAALARDLASAGARVFALELLPRITRAQSMDVLSSQATTAGYKAVLLAASHLPRMMPMMMTAAGTIPAAKAFVIGAGVAGLQAIASCRKLGAVVTAYDVRPAVKEQIESLGAKFLQIELAGAQAEGQGGYAKAMDEEFYRKQRELMGKVIAANDVVITTALVPGQKAPILVTEEMVRGMRPGSVIVDLAAEAGGNVALTEPGRVVERHGVTLVGLVDLASSMAVHASDMYARNVTTFANHLLAQGGNGPDLSDEITRGSLVTHRGEIVHDAVKAALARSGH